jgi:hypothetical protein
MYRTLMVIDTDLINLSNRHIQYFTTALRQKNGKASSIGRQELEKALSLAAGQEDGAVLIYCPSADMQSKEVDARLEIIEEKVLPLRVQTESFAYHADIRVLQQYYRELWRMYIFVAPNIYKDRIACQKIVDKFCEMYGIDTMIAYNKVRQYEFRISHDVIAHKAIEPLRAFIDVSDKKNALFSDIPANIISLLFGIASKDSMYLLCIKSGADPLQRISAIFDIAILETNIVKFTGAPKNRIQKYISRLRKGEITSRLMVKRGEKMELNDYIGNLISLASGGDTTT